jgi:outer membrane lipoprotein LolB
VRVTRRRARFVATLWVAAAIVISGCTTAPPRAPAQVEFPKTDEPFNVDGRLSARQGTKAATVHFRWTHQPPRDEMAIATPMGQSVAELQGDSSRGVVEIRTAEGKHDTAADWATLTERALGFRLPIGGLSEWIRAAPQRDQPYTIETDAQGRVALLRQNGWEIVYDYADDSARRPTRYRISYPDLEIRMVIDQWR